MKKTVYILLMAVAALSSCKKDDETPGTAMKEIAGEWFLRYSTNDGVDFDDAYSHFSTYNTADNSSTTMWFDDLGTFHAVKGNLQPVKGKVSVDLTNFTFSATAAPNISKSGQTFTILEGKMLKGAATAPASGTKTDSLYVRIQFSEEPGITYILAGYRKTGFLEDEH